MYVLLGGKMVNFAVFKVTQLHTGLHHITLKHHKNILRYFYTGQRGGAVANCSGLKSCGQLWVLMCRD